MIYAFASYRNIKEFQNQKVILLYESNSMIKTIRIITQATKTLVKKECCTRTSSKMILLITKTNIKETKGAISKMPNKQKTQNPIKTIIFYT